MARPPSTFHEFIGQTRVIRYLLRLIAGARTLGRACPSLLLIGPSGTGKTTLARAIASEYGSELHAVLAGEDLRPIDLCTRLLSLQHGDILCIDEAHSLRRDAQQVLYEALSDQKIPRLHEDRLQRLQTQSIADFTLVLATNEPGALKMGLRNRLHNTEFEPYSLRELKTIAEYVALQDQVEMTPQAARLLAEVAQGTPRSICRRLEALRCLYPHVHAFTLDHVRDLLSQEGIDEHGFSPHQRLYLHLLAHSPGGQCSLERLAIKLGCDVANIRQQIEPYLIDRGLVDPFSGRGRVLTTHGQHIAAHYVDWPQDDLASETQA